MEAYLSSSESSSESSKANFDMEKNPEISPAIASLEGTATPRPIPDDPPRSLEETPVNPPPRRSTQKRAPTPKESTRPRKQVRSSRAKRKTAPRSSQEKKISYQDLQFAPIANIFKLSNAQLKRIFNDAPSSLTNGIKTSPNAMLQAVMELRDALTRRLNEVSVSSSREKVDWFYNASIEEITTEAKERPAILTAALNAVEAEGEDFPQLDLDESSWTALLARAMSFKAHLAQKCADQAEEDLQSAQAQRDKAERIFQPLEASKTTDATLHVNFHSPVTRVNGLATSFGGVPLTKPLDERRMIEKAEAGKTIFYHPSHLPSYAPRDISIPKLNCQQIFAPSLLMDFIRDNNTVYRYVANLAVWKSPNKSAQAHKEALHIAQCIHLTILQFNGNVQRALENSLWMESATRRLHCIIMVEQEHYQDQSVSRTTLWH